MVYFFTGLLTGFLVGLLNGVIVGVIIMALCAIQKHEKNKGDD
jgi:tetrahydromethanopterin S-methyltransferase subunit B